MNAFPTEFETAGPPLPLRTGSRLESHGRDGPSCWLLLRGAMRLDLPGPSVGEPVLQLALPGDLIGFEALCGKPRGTPMRTRALTPCRLQRVAAGAADAAGRRLLDLALVQHWRRTVEIEELRTKSAACRVQRLLRALAAAESTALALGHVPPAQDIAELVDAPLAAVTRALAALGVRRTAAPAPAPAPGAAFASSARPPVRRSHPLTTGVPA